MENKVFPFLLVQGLKILDAIMLNDNVSNFRPFNYLILFKNVM